jgi:hypothetical protein
LSNSPCAASFRSAAELTDITAWAGQAASVGAFGAASISVTPGPLTPATDLETFAAAVDERLTVAPS